MGMARAARSCAEQPSGWTRAGASSAAVHGLLAAWLLLCLLPTAPVQAADSMTPGSYELTIETVMPHLEEALRYAIVEETRCLVEEDLRSAFPILRHDSLNGCTLGHESRHEDGIANLMTCAGGNGTSGSARWQFGVKQLAGRLDVKLGGKNMTFYQRVSGRFLGQCNAPAS